MGVLSFVLFEPPQQHNPFNPQIDMTKQLTKTLTFGLLFLVTSQSGAGQANHLQECWNKQVKPLQEQLLAFSYQEELNELEHSFEPWQQTNYIGKGIVWSNVDNFLKQDTLVRGKKNYFSKTQFNKTDLLFLDYGDKNLFDVTQSMFLDQIFKSARYSPIMLINYFVQQKISPDKESDNALAVYKTTINKTVVKLFIRKSDNLLDSMTTLNDDELFGDVLSIFTYSEYSKKGKLFYPATIRIEKINGKIKDEVKISLADLIPEIPPLLDKPTDYKLKEDTEIKPEIKVEKYSDNIYFIELKHTDDRVMLVEFNNFLLVAEAPLNSKNGELIISEAKKIAPTKPIRYFVFGHYHPHYLGGIRPFIHKGTKVICSKTDQEYITYLANASHSLNPDSLQIQPKPLLMEEIKDSLKITDGKFEMKIYFIGKKSEHTNDYLIYYFPSEKLLFQDDLVWIAKEGEIKKAGGRQAGLYNAVKELGLDIKTIIQSWPVADYGVKTVIPFADLEKSMNIK
jgi:hypothetical protein